MLLSSPVNFCPLIPSLIVSVLPSIAMFVPSLVEHVFRTCFCCEEFLSLIFDECLLGAGLNTPASLACLSTPLKASRYRWNVWWAMHSPLGARPFALKTKKLVRPREDRTFGDHFWSGQSFGSFW